jgi:serine/threonine protein kinase
MSNKGDVKIADFGLSVQMASNISNSFHVPVCTLLYQSPEQLFQVSKGYEYKADVWGLGCILAELIFGEPLFCTAKSFSHLIELIMQRFGQDAFENWSDVLTTKVYQNHQHRLRPNYNIRLFLKNKMPTIDPIAIDLLDKLLSIDPTNRISACDALLHPFFTEAPLPSDTYTSSYKSSCHWLRLSRIDCQKGIFQAKTERHKARPKAGELSCRRLTTPLE